MRSSRRALVVQGRKDPGGELGRASALDELDEGVQVEEPLTSQWIDQGLGETGFPQPRAPPGDHA
jgi:hypothetical protein